METSLDGYLISFSCLLLQSQKLQVEVYYEVLCPDSRYFILHQLYPAWQKVPDIMDVHFIPYGKASVRFPWHLSSGRLGPHLILQHRKQTENLYQFDCQHGPPECKGNMVHACATKLVKPAHKLVDYVRCMMNDNYDAHAAGSRCAEQVGGINWAEIEACSKGADGHRHLAEYGDMTHALSPRVSFIPTVQINGSQKGQKDMQKNFVKEVCRQFQVMISLQDPILCT